MKKVYVILKDDECNKLCQWNLSQIWGVHSNKRSMLSYLNENIRIYERLGYKIRNKYYSENEETIVLHNNANGLTKMLRIIKVDVLKHLYDVPY